MVFFATVLVFIISILTYSLYPRNDQYNLNLTKAEASVLAFVNQHQAAKDYMVQMLQVSMVDTNILDTNDITVLPEDIENMMPIGSVHEISQQQSRSPDKPEEGYTSLIACYNNNNQNTLTSDCINADHQYIITYGLAPNWWPDDVWHQETWRKAILKRTRGSATCGVLVDVPTDSTTQYYGIDTSQTITGPTTYSFTSNNNTVTKRVLPPPISKKIIGDQTTPGLLWNVYNNFDILFCMSPFTNPYVQSNLVFHWDSINNNTTQHAGNTTDLLVGNWINTPSPTSEAMINITSSSTTWTISGVVTPTTTKNSFLLNGGTPFIIVQRFQGTNSNDNSYIKIGENCVQVPNRTFSFTYDSNNNVYINGQAGKTATCPQDMGNTSTSINLANVTLANPLNSIANFKIYDTNLSADDIQKNYKADQKRFGIIPERN